MTPDPIATLTSTAASVSALVRRVDEPGSWAPTPCRGWAVRDVVAHLWQDAARALVAVHTPHDGPVDTDAVSYWRAFGTDTAGPGTAGAAAGRRYVRVMASMFADWRQLRDEYLATTAAMTRAVEAADPTAVVATQGLALTVADLAETLAVEAAIHHLDLRAALGEDAHAFAPGDAAAGLRLVRATANALAGQDFPSKWSTERVARLATGRAQASSGEAAALGDLADRLPLFG